MTSTAKNKNKTTTTTTKPNASSQRPRPNLKTAQVKSAPQDSSSNSGNPPKVGLNPEVLAAADKLAKDLKEAKDGKEAGKVFDDFVASHDISSETMNKTTGAVFQEFAVTDDPEIKKVRLALVTLSFAIAKSPELNTQKEKEDALKDEAKALAEKPLKDYFAAVRAKIVKAKGGEGWSTTKKILVFGGGALALGGLVYLATRKTDTPRKSKKPNI